MRADVAGRSLCLAVALFLALPAALRGQVGVDPEPTLRIPIGHMHEMHHQAVLLADHSIVAIVRNAFDLVAFDSTGRSKWKRTLRPGGVGGFEAFTSVLHAATGQVTVWDNQLSRLTTLDVGNRDHGRRHVDRLPRHRTPGGGMGSQFLVIAGQMADRRLIAAIRERGFSEQGEQVDSTTAFLIDATGKHEPVARLLDQEVFLFRSSPMVSGNLPFGRAGRIVVGTSSWFYTDGSTFAIEQRHPDGRLMATFRADRTRRPVDAEAIRRSRLRAIAGADSVMKSSVIRALAWMPYPDSMPAYSDLQIDAEGVLWARVYTPDWEAGLWDLFDQHGRHLGEVSLPPGLRVLDIGDDALLAYQELPGEGDGVLLLFRLQRQL